MMQSKNQMPNLHYLKFQIIHSSSFVQLKVRQ
nr:MAG TPA: hypothetical protein [Caudoviricetes sp.]